MPVFSLLSLFLAFIAETGSALQKMLINDYAVYAGLGMAGLAIAGSFFKKIPEMIGYDLFSSGALIAWFALWKPLFTHDSPIFFFFPAYFALISAMASLFTLGRRRKMAADDLKLLRAIDESGAVDPWMIMLAVLVTLYFENHFLQYPVWMTLLVIRYRLSGYVLAQKRDSL